MVFASDIEQMGLQGPRPSIGVPLDRHQGGETCLRSSYSRLMLCTFDICPPPRKLQSNYARSLPRCRDPCSIQLLSIDLLSIDEKPQSGIHSKAPTSAQEPSSHWQPRAFSASHHYHDRYHDVLEIGFLIKGNPHAPRAVGSGSSRCPVNGMKSLSQHRAEE